MRHLANGRRDTPAPMREPADPVREPPAKAVHEAPTAGEFWSRKAAMKPEALPQPPLQSEAHCPAPFPSRPVPRKSLRERLETTHWLSQCAVSLPGWGRIGTARIELGRVKVKLYERHRANMDAIKVAFEAVYGEEAELVPPTDPDLLRHNRAFLIPRYGRRG